MATSGLARPAAYGAHATAAMGSVQLQPFGVTKAVATTVQHSVALPAEIVGARVCRPNVLGQRGVSTNTVPTDTLVDDKDQI
jgi:hypothetical protein